MNLNSILHELIFRGSHRLVLSLLMVSMPCSLALAQDFEKVETKLKKSVAKGHLTELQAKEMMGTLRRITDKESNAIQGADTSKNSEANLADAGVRIRKLVAAGEITEEDGRTRMDIIREKLAGEESLSAEAALEAFGMKLRQAVRNGRITTEDGRARLEAFRKQLNDTAASDKVRLEGMEQRVRAAIASADKARKDAGAAVAAINHQMKPADNEKKKAALEQAVNNGRLTAEDAQRRIEELEQHRATANSKGPFDESRLERVAKRLEMAVKNGDLSVAEARQKFREIKEQLQEPDDHHDSGQVPKRVDDAPRR